MSIPGKYVEPLDLVDEHEDRATRRGNLVPLVARKTLTPVPQETEFFRVQAAACLHQPTLSRLAQIDHWPNEQGRELSSSYPLPVWPHPSQCILRARTYVTSHALPRDHEVSPGPGSSGGD